jgi:hypothetical protein
MFLFCFLPSIVYADSLQKALDNQDSDLLDKIFSSGVNPDSKIHGTPIILFIPYHSEGCSTDMLEVFIKHGADLDISGEKVKLPVITTILEYNEEACFNLLIKNGVNVFLSDDAILPLAHFAAMGGNLDMFKVLIEKGMKTDSLGSKGTTPLMAAAARGKKEIVKYLVEDINVNVCTPDDKGRTAKDLAITNGFKDIIKFLPACE